MKTMKTMKYKDGDVVIHKSNHGQRMVIINCYDISESYLCGWITRDGIHQEKEFFEFELQLSEW